MGGYRKDRKTGVEGLTLAGLLMFGTGQAIRERFDKVKSGLLKVLLWVNAGKKLCVGIYG